MSSPTTNAELELQAVNEILASVGQAPVTSLDQTNPDVAIANSTLKEVSREVQAEGWTFNREYNYPIPVNSENEILVPTNVLQMDLNKNYVNADKCAVVRSQGGQRKMYDRYNHTFKWSPSPVYFDMLWYYEWIDLPIPMQEFIVARSAVIVSQRIIGDPQQFQMLQSREAYCRSNAQEYETRQGKYTMFGSPEGQDYYVSYQPFHALYR